MYNIVVIIAVILGLDWNPRKQMEITTSAVPHYHYTRGDNKMPAIITTKEFIKRARKIHGNKYDYSKSIYKNCKTKILIICKKHGKFLQSAYNHLSGKQCKKCSASNTLTLEEFIKKSKKIHGNKYRYNLVEYSNCRTKVKILCPFHGIFLQKPSLHLRGKGCLKCYRQRQTKTTKGFIKRAKSIHGNKYDYSLSIYKRNYLKIKIICLKCGNKFLQSPASHLVGSGCSKCAGNTHKDAKTFIKESKIVHKNRYQYNYQLVLREYKNNYSLITIQCPVHGVFRQRASFHLCGQGCKKCAIEKLKWRKDDFIKKCNRVHHYKYDYSLSDISLGVRRKITIICPKHGEFRQTAWDHSIGAGCPKCCGNISKPEVLWLNKMRVPNKPPNRHVTIHLSGKRYCLDGFIKKTNTIYEFNGDFFHGNPRKFRKQDYNLICHKTFGEPYKKTKNKEKELKKAGYKLVTIWESDFKKQLKCLRSNS